MGSNQPDGPSRTCRCGWSWPGSVSVVAAITLAPSLRMNWVGSLLVGHRFVATGEIVVEPDLGNDGCQLRRCLVFLVLGWTTPANRIAALSVAAVVCIAASNAGTTSQDLKTGFLLGATPKWQQWSILLGAGTSSLVMGWTLVKLNDAGTVYTQAATCRQSASTKIPSTA